MVDDKKPRDPARARFFALVLIRWTGVALVLVGMLINAGRIALPGIVGIALVAIGLFDAFVMPVILARRWKTGA